MKSALTILLLQEEARSFAEMESSRNGPSLHGIPDGKAVGTYLEHKFQGHLRSRYDYVEGSSAKGVDFPELGVDLKVTSIRQPQSSCPSKPPSRRSTVSAISLFPMLFSGGFSTGERLIWLGEIGGIIRIV